MAESPEISPRAAFVNLPGAKVLQNMAPEFIPDLNLIRSEDQRFLVGMTGVV